MPPRTRFLTVCAFFCHCNSVAAFSDHEAVGVAVLSHLYHRLIPLQPLAQLPVAWDHVRVNIPHAPTLFSIPHSACESTHSLYFEPYQTQRPEFLAGDTLLHNTR